MQPTQPFDEIEIRPLADADEAAQCVQMMEQSEPWRTLNTSRQTLATLMLNPLREHYVAVAQGRLAGVLVLNLSGPLSGYIQAICVAPEFRAHGAGKRLMAYAEDRIFRESPNVFLLVSDFNARARQFYQRLGYQAVGELPEFLFAGHAEILMRKTRGPIFGYRPAG